MEALLGRLQKKKCSAHTKRYTPDNAKDSNSPDSDSGVNRQQYQQLKQPSQQRHDGPNLKSDTSNFSFVNHWLATQTDQYASGFKSIFEHDNPTTTTIPPASHNQTQRQDQKNTSLLSEPILSDLVHRSVYCFTCALSVYLCIRIATSTPHPRHCLSWTSKHFWTRSTVTDTMTRTPHALRSLSMPCVHTLLLHSRSPIPSSQPTKRIERRCPTICWIRPCRSSTMTTCNPA